MSKTYYIQNFGCQMNYADSERFSAILNDLGFVQTHDLKKADIYVLNSCSIRQKAEDRILGLGKEIKKLKEKNKQLKIVLTGCMTRRKWDDNIKIDKKNKIQQNTKDRILKLKRQIPWVDIIIESKDFHQIYKFFNKKPSYNIDNYLEVIPDMNSTFKGFIPISIGCDHFCTYCIVPFARGKEICREYSDILNEITDLINKGYKDITLLGQTVNKWINPKFKNNINIQDINTNKIVKGKEPKDFLQLLEAIDQIEGNYWITFMSSHPNYFTEELIEFIGKSKHIKPYIHLALQSGSNRILKKMNRKHTIEEFSKKIQLMKKNIKELGLSTDIIVGFPGETKADFNETVKAMKNLKFDMAYLSEFSSRQGTVAALLKDDVSNKEKANRKKYLNDEILAKTALEHNNKMVGKTYKCLIEKIDEQNILLRSGNNKEIRASKINGLNEGMFVNVRILKASPWALSGEILL